MNDDEAESDRIRQSVRNFVVDNFLFGDDTKLEVNVSFLDSGTIDSMGFLELVTFLETTYEIAIFDHELVPENIDSISNVVAFLTQKLEAISDPQRPPASAS